MGAKAHGRMAEGKEGTRDLGRPIGLLLGPLGPLSTLFPALVRHKTTADRPAHGPIALVFFTSFLRGNFFRVVVDFVRRRLFTFTLLFFRTSTT